MKNRKIAALFTAFALTVGTASLVSGCGSSTGTTASKTASTTASNAASSAVTYQYISAEEVLKVTDGHIVDVREEDKYKAGAIEGSDWQAIFPLEDTSLEAGMKEYAAKVNDGKNIYIVCNSGKRGAEKTTKILTESGIDKSKIFTVEGGAKALSEIEGALKPVQ